MPYTHKTGITYSNDEGTIASTTNSFTGSEEVGVDDNISALTTDKELALAVTVADIVSMCLFCALPLTVKTYKGGTLKQTIALAANQQQTWNNTDAFTCPITDDFDHIYVTNPDATKVARLRCRFLLVGVGS